MVFWVFILTNINLLSEHEKGLSVDVVIRDLAGDHGVEAWEGGDQVGEADRREVLEILPIQVGQLLCQEVGVLCSKRKCELERCQRDAGLNELNPALKRIEVWASG